MRTITSIVRLLLLIAGALYVYDTAADRWEDCRPAPTRRDHLAAAALHRRLYVAGGREQTLSKNLATLEVYDPATDTWGLSRQPPWPSPARDGPKHDASGR